MAIAVAPTFYTGPLTMAPVESSQIAAIGYDAATLTLGVTFKQGGHYRYAGVQPEDFEAFRQAPSAGRHFDKFIRGRYSYRGVQNPPAGDADVPGALDHLTRALQSTSEQIMRSEVRAAMAALGAS
ncbi:MAG: KTSC domain-containing protein [Anaerolineae bacterium]|nr:KTSC domain-containing protein [Anaerolineae bacterium]